MAKASLAKRRSTSKAYQAAKKTPLGTGTRFAALKASAAAGGARNPAAVAAAAGRKKYGKVKMTKWAVKGKKAG